MSTLVVALLHWPFGALPDGQQSNGELIAALRSERRPAHRAYKFSVAELEERQRSVGASIEYVDDLSAAYRWSPVFRAGIGIDNPIETLRSRKDSAKKPGWADPVELGKTQRCGFSWDDAAAKCGPPCPLALDSECNVNRPKHGVNATYIKQNYTCYSGLPYCNPQKPLGTCYSKDGAVPDDYCAQTCNSEEFVCNHKMCVCDEHEYPLSTPIEPLPTWVAPENMTERTNELLDQVKLAEARQMGLPECLWKPGPGCTNHTPYECLSNAKCAHAEEASCNLKCLHVSLLTPAPYYALWRPGPLANPKAFIGAQARIPHYTHDNMRHQLEFTRHVSSGSVMMSAFCKKKINGFVGVTMYSPKFEEKARRLLDSCQRIGICCKATLLPPDAYGPKAPEGSEEFRFRTIALKPAFILSQLKATRLPVVWLDTDLEFHSFPRLFMPGSWPDGDRDVALFNFWGNETNLTARHIPNTGSAVAFFQQTYRAKKLLVAWAEAMAYEPNKRAPDDQVLDLLLVEGGWLKRASFGWLPAAYLRMMPSYYRGVDPVIDHDHGNPPGLLKHSEAKPVLPPVADYEDIEHGDVGSTADALAKCKAVKEGFEDIWCQRQCGTDRSAAGCPQEDCVCDWSGDWPDDDKDGFAAWSLDSLGIKEEHKEAHKETKSSSPQAGGDPAPQAAYTGMTPAEVLAICARPVAWCAHVGATNEPKECGGEPGHFCHDIYGKAGFKPCDESKNATWGPVTEVECEPSPAPARGEGKEAAAATEQEQAVQEEGGAQHGDEGKHEGKHVPLTAEEICDRPKAWCNYAGATNEPRECDEMPGHFCRDIYGKSGFWPCDEKIAPSWGHFECMGPPSAPPSQAAAAAAVGPAPTEAAEEAEAEEAPAPSKPTKAEEKEAREKWSNGANEVKDGADCFLVCGQKPGTCDDFCGRPGMWGGVCCKNGAQGAESAPECRDEGVALGCIGYHCCVSRPLSDAGRASSAAGTQQEPAEPASHKYHKPEWSAEDLAELFKAGRPSNHLDHAGLLVHGFDGTELDEMHRWRPCATGFCKGAVRYWSASIINQVHPATWGGNGLVFSPSRGKVLCSHTCDFGSLNSGCAASAPDGFNGTGRPYPPDHLKDMLQRSMYEPGLMRAYNEVLLDTKDYVDQLPHSLAAFYYKEAADAHSQVSAAHAYVSFLDAYNLTEDSIPLLMFHTTSGGKMEGRHAITDVSGGARLHAARYAAMHEKWRKNHPYLDAHPELRPAYVRAQAAQRGEYLPVRRDPAEWADRSDTR